MNVGMVSCLVRVGGLGRYMYCLLAWEVNMWCYRVWLWGVWGLVLHQCTRDGVKMSWDGTECTGEVVVG